MIKEYGGEDGEEEENEEEDLTGDSDEAPDLITSREDFEAMMDDFLDNYELLGRKMQPVLQGDTGLEKLDTFRRALGHDGRVRIGDAEDEDDEEQIMMPFEANDKKDRWDCETILSECRQVLVFLPLFCLTYFCQKPPTRTWKIILA